MNPNILLDNITCISPGVLHGGPGLPSGDTEQLPTTRLGEVHPLGGADLARAGRARRSLTLHGSDHPTH